MDLLKSVSGITDNALSREVTLKIVGLMDQGKEEEANELMIEEGVDKTVISMVNNHVRAVQNDGLELIANRYIVVREIARGGQGKVLECLDPQLKYCKLAVKTLLEPNPKLRKKFIKEREISALIRSHPNLMSVIDGGTFINKDGVEEEYYAMDYVENGRDLEKILTKEKDSFSKNDLLRIVIDVCDGLSFAHAKGVVHRDIKPANIMVGPFNEVFVTDFGLAKIIAEKTTEDYQEPVRAMDIADIDDEKSLYGSVSGTPHFMSPEQAIGDSDKINPTTDTWAVGVILYIIETKTTPFPGDNLGMILNNIIQADPMKPREINPDINEAMQDIILRAISKEQCERYEAKELATHLKLYLEGNWGQLDQRMGKAKTKSYRLKSAKEKLLDREAQLKARIKKKKEREEVTAGEELQLFDVYNRLIDAAIKTGSRDKVKEYFEKADVALSDAEKELPRRKLIRKILNSHVYLIDKDRHKEGIMLLEDAAKYGKEIDELDLSVTAMTNLAVSFYTRVPGYENKVIPTLEKAAALGEQINSEFLGKIYLFVGNESGELGARTNNPDLYETAIMYLEKSVAICRKKNDLGTLCDSLKVNGEQLYRLGRYEKALDQHEESLCLAIRAENPYNAADNHKYIGMNLFMLEKIRNGFVWRPAKHKEIELFSDAQTHFDRAREIFASIKSPPGNIIAEIETFLEKHT